MHRAMLKFKMASLLLKNSIAHQTVRCRTRVCGSQTDLCKRANHLRPQSRLVLLVDNFLWQISPPTVFFGQGEPLSTWQTRGLERYLQLNFHYRDNVEHCAEEGGK